MKHVARNRTLLIPGAVGCLIALLLGNYAFDKHDIGLIGLSVVLGFGAFTLFAVRWHRQHESTGRDAEVRMSDDWTPHTGINPSSGLPMVDGAIDVQGNAYGSSHFDHQRRGG